MRYDHLLLAVALAVPCSAAAQVATDDAVLATRVQFARGQTAIALREELAARTARDYVLRARAGQTLTIHLDAPGAGELDVIAPGGERGRSGWSMMPALQEGRWSTRLLTSGDYRVRVRNPASRPVSFYLAIAIGHQIIAAARPTGHYHTERNTLSADLLPDGSVRFELLAFAGTGDALHFGTASGVIPLRGHTAIYVADACQLTLRFSDDRVYVTQSGTDSECDFGASVAASGVYLRDGDRPRWFESAPSHP